MSNLLVRDVDEDTKRALAVRAAEHGRSQQAEALSILRHELNTDKANWMQMLYDAAQEVGGIDLELPQRHAPRFTGTMM